MKRATGPCQSDPKRVLLICQAFVRLPALLAAGGYKRSRPFTFYFKQHESCHSLFPHNTFSRILCLVHGGIDRPQLIEKFMSRALILNAVPQFIFGRMKCAYFNGSFFMQSANWHCVRIANARKENAL